jgi:hypothetical protein
MPKPEVKGDLFQQTYELIEKKWGKEGLGRIGLRRKQYKMEKWYPFEEYCGLLEAAVLTLGSGDITILFQIGCDMIVNDVRWPIAFKGKNPGKVFDTTRTQDSQFRIGKFDIEKVSKKHIHICMDLWCDVLQGVLIITGYLGRVEKEKNKTDWRKQCVYDITWR